MFITSGLYSPNGFDPTSIPGLLMWCQSSDVVIDPLDNRVISINQLAPTAVTDPTRQYGAGSGPLFVTDVQAGKPALRFSNNTAERLLFNGVLFNNSTAFFISSNPAWVAARRNLIGRDSGTQSIEADNALIEMYRINTYFGSPKSNDAIDPALPHLIKMDITPTSARLGINTGWGATVNHSQGNISWNQLGAQRTFGNNQWSGDIFEVIVYSNLSAADILKAEKGLMRKYGI